jgi:23S rRNA (cytidine1920-2'-O)/16S rRNA (cytidine1409-2'-O)-methyltransferase
VRSITPDDVPEAVSAIVADVSFVSLTKVLEPALALAAKDAWLIALVKPQFEVGPGAVGKGGIVRDLEARAEALAFVKRWLSDVAGWRVFAEATWPGLKGKSNEEYLIGARRNDE